MIPCFIFVWGLVLKVCFSILQFNIGRPRFAVQLTQVDSFSVWKRRLLFFEDHHFPASYPRVRASVSRLSQFVYPDFI